MKSDDEIKSDWARIDSENINMACEYLRRHENGVEDYIAHIVASLCNIDVETMLTTNNTSHVAQPRWLYWYAMRYMTNETYEKLAERTTSKCGHKFSPNGIGQSINKMAEMISHESIWNKRWTIIKHIIKLRDSNTIEYAGKDTVTMELVAPKDVKVEIKYKQ